MWQTLTQHRLRQRLTVVAGQHKEAQVRVLVGRRDEEGRSVVVNKHVAVPRLRPHRASAPDIFIVAADRVALKHRRLARSIVARLPVAPHDELLRLRAEQQFGPFNHAPPSQVGVAASVLDDFVDKFPMDKVRRTVQVDVWHPRRRTVLADEVPHAVLQKEVAAVGIDRPALSVHPCLTVLDGGPCLGQRTGGISEK